MPKHHYIGGEWLPGAGAPFMSFDPATDHLIWKGNAATPEEVDTAVQKARTAFVGWRALSYQQRCNYLNQFAAALKIVRQEIAFAISTDTGKPLWESTAEVGAMINKIEITQQAYQERCGEKSQENQGATAWIRHKPHGVVAVLGPFNFPGHLPNGHIVPALLAGNTVVFKPSELTPCVSTEIMHVWEQADLPAGVLNLVQGGIETGRALAEHPDIDGIFFTGSWRTGHALQESVLRYPHRIIALEMGGNNPLVVDECHSQDAAVYHTIQSAFITSGQRCTCARRLILVKNKSSQAFLDRLITVTRSLTVGLFTRQPEPFMGSVISKEAAKRILQAEKQLLSQGAKSLVPLKLLQENTGLLSPGIVDVTGVQNLEDEEIFGPLLKVIWVNDFESALREANRTRYGLSAGLLSDDPERYQQFLKHIRAGIVNWNRPITGASSSAPFGGIGQSGNHRPSAYYAVDYCAYPVASLEDSKLSLPQQLTPGISMS